MENHDRPFPHCFVLFGATGDLADPKLFPGLYRLALGGRLPTEYAVIGAGRYSPGSDEEFRDRIRGSLENIVGDLDDAVMCEFLSRVTFQTSNANNGTDLAAAVRRARSHLGDDAHWWKPVGENRFADVAEAGFST